MGPSGHPHICQVCHLPPARDSGLWGLLGTGVAAAPVLSGLASGEAPRPRLRVSNVLEGGRKMKGDQPAVLCALFSYPASSLQNAPAYGGRAPAFPTATPSSQASLPQPPTPARELLHIRLLLSVELWVQHEAPPRPPRPWKMWPRSDTPPPPQALCQAWGTVVRGTKPVLRQQCS